jgi:TP901 family phage tail tape measure protein
MPEVGRVEVRLTANAEDLRQGLLSAQNRLRAFGASVRANEQHWRTLGMTLGAAGAGIAAALGVGVKWAISFEREMRNVNSILKQSEPALAALSQSVRDMAGKVGQGPAVLARGLYDIASSGFAGADGLKVLEASAVAATAGLSDTATASKAITAVLNAYGKGADQATHVSDVLFKTVELGVVTFDQLAQNLGDVISTAAQARVPLEEVGAAISVMTRAGVQPAEAVTSLNQVLLSFISPTSQAASAAKALGLELSATHLATVGLSGVMVEIGEALHTGVDDLDAMTAAGKSQADIMEAVAQKAGMSTEALATLFPNVRALRGALVLASDAGRTFTGDLEKFADAGGSAQAAFAQQSESLSVQLQKVKANVQALGIEIGSTFLPLLKRLADGMQTVTANLRDFNRLHGNAAKAVEGLAAAVGGLLLGSAGLIVLATWLAKVTEALGVLGIAFGTGAGGAAAGATTAAGAVSAFSAVLATIGWAVAIAGAWELGAQLGHLAREWDTAKSAAQDYRDMVADAVKAGHLTEAPREPGAWKRFWTFLAGDRAVPEGTLGYLNPKYVGKSERERADRGGAPALPSVTAPFVPQASAEARNLVALGMKLQAIDDKIADAKARYATAAEGAKAAILDEIAVLQTQRIPIAKQLDEANQRQERTAEQMAQAEQTRLQGEITRTRGSQWAIKVYYDWLVKQIAASKALGYSQEFVNGLLGERNSIEDAHQAALKQLAVGEKQRNDETKQDWAARVSAMQSYLGYRYDIARTETEQLAAAAALRQFYQDQEASLSFALTELQANTAEWSRTREEIERVRAAIRALDEDEMTRLLHHAKPLPPRPETAGTPEHGEPLGWGWESQPVTGMNLPGSREALEAEEELLALQIKVFGKTQETAAAKDALIAKWREEEAAARAAVTATVDGSDEQRAALERVAAAQDHLNGLTKKQPGLWDNLAATAQSALESIRQKFEEALFQVVRYGGTFGDFWKAVWDDFLRLAIHALVQWVIETIATAKLVKAAVKDANSGLTESGGGGGGGGGAAGAVGGAAAGYQAGGVWGAVIGAVGGWFGLWQHGGRVQPGQVGIVGERGPELFVPDRSGTIIPNDMLPAAPRLSLQPAWAGAAGGATRAVSVQPGAFQVTVYAHELNERVVRNAGGLLADEVSRRLGWTDRRSGV